MGKTLSELIADAAVNDDTQFSLPDGTVYRLGDVRTFKNEVLTERKAAENARKEAEKTALEAKNIFDALKAAQEEMNKNTPKDDGKAKGSDWRKNPLYDEIVPVFDALEAKATQAFDRAEKLSKSLELSQATYAAERLRREWAEAKVKPKDKKFEDVVAEILQSKEVDEFGLPTLSKYLYRATEGDRIKAAQDEAVAAAKKEWEKAAHAAAIPKPGGKFQTRKSGEGPIKKLDELTSDVVANDPDIQSAMEGLLQ